MCRQMRNLLLVIESQLRELYHVLAAEEEHGWDEVPISTKHLLRNLTHRVCEPDADRSALGSS